MRLIRFLFQASWRTVLLASSVGGISGLASIGLLALIHRTLKNPATTGAMEVGLFVACCVAVIASRILSQVLLTRLSQDSLSRIRMGLAERILTVPLRRLEEVGDHRLITALTNDVATIAMAANGLPVLIVNLMTLFCGAAYLAWLSPKLLLAAIFVCCLGVGSYVFTSRFARKYIVRGREAQDTLMRHIRSLLGGIKELKVHQPRRREFTEDVLALADSEVRENQFVGFCLQGASIAWGRMIFMIAIGLLLFAWPRVDDVDGAQLTGYTLTILYLMTPLERIIGWLPLFERSTVAVRKIRRIGLALEEAQPEQTDLCDLPDWKEIRLVELIHSYSSADQNGTFELGPIDLAIERREVLFIVGGNGSGKTTLGKLITGLYEPAHGRIQLDDLPIDGKNRESYRQLFSVVFDDAMVFETLLGMETEHLDAKARELLELLGLQHVVEISGGQFSSTSLSRGQRKRLALLTAYLEDRDVYFFDEWAADQDPEFKRVFYHHLVPDLQARGKTVVAITHDDRYFSTADRVLKLDEGHIVELRAGETV